MATQRVCDGFPRTFREDYRIEGADGGEVHVHYSGACNVCCLKLEFHDVHPIPGL